MKNADLALRIKQLRTSGGYSQADLALNTRLSLRTIQRIESGEVVPRGDTLRRLSAVLNIETEELTEREEQPDKTFMVLFNLSALSFIVFPILGVLVPLVLWALRKDKVNGLNSEGKKLLNFEITWCMLSTLVFVLSIGSKISHVNLTANLPLVKMDSFELFMFGYFGLYACNILFIVVNAIRVSCNRNANYFAAVPFLR